MTEYEKFLKAVRQGKKIYKSKSAALQNQLKLAKEKASKNNRGLIPYIDKHHCCHTCGDRSGKSHPESSYCFICDTDNWQYLDN